MRTIKLFYKILLCLSILANTSVAKGQTVEIYVESGTVTSPITVGATYEECVTVYNSGASGYFDFELDLDNSGGGYVTVMEKQCSQYIASGGSLYLCFTSNAPISTCGSYELNLRAAYSSCADCGTTASCYVNAISNGFTNPQPITVPCGCTNWSVSPSTQSVPANGGSYSATVYATGGCSYDLTFNDTWLVFSSYGTGLFNYTVQPNTSCSSRTGTISINDATNSINNLATLTVTQDGLSVTPSVSISANPSGVVCSGHTVTFTPTPTNGGSPSYEWYLNGSPVGSGSTYTTTALTSNASVYCIMTSSANCASPTSATSPTTSVTVDPSVTPQVNITANPSGAVCSGHTVTFTPNSTNGGNPTYQWYLNGNQVASGSSYTTSALTSNASVYCIMTSTANCVSPTTATSLTTSITVNPPVTPSVSISANPSGPICSGSTVTFTPTPTNGGNPTYEWYMNGSQVASGSSYTTSTLSANTTVYCIMTSTENCASPSTATSLSTSLTVNQVPVTISQPTQTACTGVQVSFPASGASTYSWSGSEVGGETTPTATGTYNVSGTYEVTVTGTSSGCSATATASVTINTQPAIPITFNPANPTGCGSVTVTAGSSNCQGCTYNWSTGTNAAITNITSPGTNNYTVTVSGGGNCTAVGSVSATVNTQPVVTSVTASNNNNGTYCQNQSLTLTANATGGTTYAWSGSGVANNNSSTTMATPTSSTTYGVTVSDGSCSAQGSVNVTVTPAVTPSVSFGQLPGSVCIDGQHSVTITANATNGGTNPTYSWSSSYSGNPNNNTYSLSNISASCTVSCTLTSNAECATSTTATSTTNVQETTPLPASLRITIPDTNVCITDQATFTASPVNGGGSPVYAWYVNNSYEGSGNIFHYTFPSIGVYNVSCTMTSSLSCFTPATATSNTLIINVTGQATPGVAISASALSICAGTADTIAAIASTGGNNPTYQWYLNTNPVSGNNTALFASSTLHNNDSVYCIMTSNSSCATAPTATSNTVHLTVNTLLQPQVSISSNPAGPVCTGAQVTYTAMPTNGGTNPVFEWLVNGNYQSVNSNIFPDNSVNNHDVIACVLISNATCATPDSVVSGSITATVDTAVTPSVNIASSAGNSFCTGTCVTFTATSLHGGTAPGYAWTLNAGQVGADSSSFSTCALNNGDVVSCVLTSNATCATANTATSNSITFTISSSISPTISIVESPAGPVCPGKPITFTVTGQSGGGSSPSYQWKVIPSIGNTGNGGTIFVDSTLTSSDTVLCLMTSSLSCANPAIVISNGITPSLYPSPGNTITPSGTSFICPGDSIKLCAAAGNPDYEWSTGASVQCIYVQFTGQYFVTATNVNLCTATASATLEDYPIPSPDIKNIADSLYTDTAATSYQWYLNNNPVAGATSAGYVAVQNGSYYLVATEGNGCSGQSAVITLTHVGIHELTSVSYFSITPNPSNGKFLIAFETAVPEDIAIKVFDPLGRIIKADNNVIVKGNYSEEMDLGDVSSGIYIIQLVSGNKTLNRKLEITK